MDATSTAASTATESVPGESGASPLNWRGRKAWRIVLALGIFVFSTYWALNKENRPDPFESIRFLSWKWWTNPLEVNAPARLPMVSGTLTSMDISDNGYQVYVAGQAGLLVRYDA